MEILIIFILIILNGVFAMSEMALVSAKKFKLENAKKKGSSGAHTALELSENPTKFLSTVQIGITLIGIVLGVYSGEKVQDDVETLLSQVSFMAPYAVNIAPIIIVVLLTYFSIILGELLPKRLGMTFPETMITLLAKPMKLISQITSPFVWLLSASNNFLLKVFGIKQNLHSRASEEEIKTIIAESVLGGEIQEIEHDIVHRVFELGDKRVNNLMTHRSDIVYFTMDESWESIREKINTEKHSAYPVSRSKNLDDIVGIVLIKDLFYTPSYENFDLASLIIKPIYFNENTFSYQVLETFKQQKLHYGVVIDEYGSVNGMITMDDVLEALVGEMEQSEFSIIKRDEFSWLVDGQYPILEFAKEFDLTDEIEKSYTTVAGLILHQLARLPEVGEKLQIGPYTFEIIDMDGHRIDKVMVMKVG